MYLFIWVFKIHEEKSKRKRGKETEKKKTPPEGDNFFRIE
jgi:hypothetical protein